MDVLTQKIRMLWISASDEDICSLNGNIWQDGKIQVHYNISL